MRKQYKENKTLLNKKYTIKNTNKHNKLEEDDIIFYDWYGEIKRNEEKTKIESNYEWLKNSFDKKLIKI